MNKYIRTNQPQKPTTGQGTKSKASTPTSYDDSSYNNPGGSKDNENDATVDITTFQNLLNKLEGSKLRQQRQQSVEKRRDIYAQGLSSMMRNF